MTLYQVVVSPSRISQAMSHVLLTWQADDRLLLIGSSGILADIIVTHYPQFKEKIFVLPQDKADENSVTTISHPDWVNGCQQHTTVTLDFL